MTIARFLGPSKRDRLFYWHQNMIKWDGMQSKVRRLLFTVPRCPAKNNCQDIDESAGLEAVLCFHWFLLITYIPLVHLLDLHSPAQRDEGS